MVLSNTLCALISCVSYTFYFIFKNHHFIPAYIVGFFVSMLHQFKFLLSTLCEIMPVFLEYSTRGLCLPSIASVTFMGNAIDIMCNCCIFCSTFFLSVLSLFVILLIVSLATRLKNFTWSVETLWFNSRCAVWQWTLWCTDKNLDVTPLFLYITQL